MLQRKVLHLAIHQRGEGQVVEEVCEVFPDVGVPILPQTLVIEPVNLGDLSALVVSSDQCDPVWVSHLRSCLCY